MRERSVRNKYILKSLKKRHNRYAVVLVTLILLIMAAVVAISMYNINQKKVVYDLKKQQLQQELDLEAERTREIEEYAKYTKTKKFAEDIAKEKLGLVKDDEIIFKSENTQ